MKAKSIMNQKKESFRHSRKEILTLRAEFAGLFFYDRLEASRDDVKKGAALNGDYI